MIQEVQEVAQVATTQEAEAGTNYPWLLNSRKVLKKRLKPEGNKIHTKHALAKYNHLYYTQAKLKMLLYINTYFNDKEIMDDISPTGMSDKEFYDMWTTRLSKAGEMEILEELISLSADLALGRKVFAKTNGIDFYLENKDRLQLYRTIVQESIEYGG